MRSTQVKVRASMAVATLTVGIRNDLNKTADFKVHGLDLTAGNIVAQTAAADALKTAVVALSVGNFASMAISTHKSKSATIPTGEVQLGDKWVITAADALGNTYTYTIPAEDSTDNLIPGTHNADPASTDWAAFITAFNAYAVNRVGGALTFVSARLGTRLGT